MSFKYPFNSETSKKLSELRKNQDYYIWRSDGPELKSQFSKVDKPIVEIGGPSDEGYYFLDGVELLSRPVITNISKNPLPYSEHAKKFASMVDELVDGTSMPYSDSSVGLFLISYMSGASDWWVELSEAEIKKQKSKIDKTYDEAELEQGQFAIGTLPFKDVKSAQRLKIYHEVYRCLVKDGYLICNGNLDDIISLKNMGFKIVAYLQEHLRSENWYGIVYEFVVQK